MATSIQIPLAEYLSTTYRPAREYIDGELMERNVGNGNTPASKHSSPPGSSTMSVPGKL